MNMNQHPFVITSSFTPDNAKGYIKAIPEPQTQSQQTHASTSNLSDTNNIDDALNATNDALNRTASAVKTAKPKTYRTEIYNLAKKPIRTLMHTTHTTNSQNVPVVQKTVQCLYSSKGENSNDFTRKA